MQNPIRLPCQHHFCLDCAGSTECIICSKPFNVTDHLTDKVSIYLFFYNNFLHVLGFKLHC